MSGPRVRRPKSMATVVPVFWLPSPAKSIPRLSTVMSASVMSGSISEMVPTNVVLPTAYPPATTIFIDTGRPVAAEVAPNGPGTVCGAGGTKSDRTDPLQQTFEQPHVAVLGLVFGLAHVQHARDDEVADEHAHDTDGSAEACSDLGHRHRRLAQLHDATVLG